MVFNLQKIIGVRHVDGLYGPVTDSAYNKFMSKYKKYLIAEYERYKQ